MYDNKAFTLVEILTTVTILLVIGTVFFRYFVYSQEVTVENKEKLEALNIAQGVLENVSQGVYQEDILLPGKGEEYKLLNEENCSGINCKERYNIAGFLVEIRIYKEKDFNLYPVEILVYEENGNDRSNVKRLVELYESIP